jgi:hypothetical protein
VFSVSVSSTPSGRGFSRSIVRWLSCCSTQYERIGSRAAAHRLDESHQLSLSMVASLQCLLPFRPVRSLWLGWKSVQTSKTASAADEVAADREPVLTCDREPRGSRPAVRPADPARIAGHSSMAMSARYVRPSEDADLDALDRLSAHNFGHNGNSRLESVADRPWLTATND